MALIERPNFSTLGPANPLKYIAVLAAAGLAVITVLNSYFIVDPTQMAGTRWLGGSPMETTPLGTGLHFKWPFLETVDFLQTSRTLLPLDDLDIHTVDNQDVHLSITVSYEIPPDAVLPLLYNVGQAGNVDINSMITSTIASRTLTTFAGYNTTDISANLQIIADRLDSIIGTQLKQQYGIDVLQVNLANVTYSQAFSNAIEDAVQAKAEAVAAQNTVLQKTYEGQQAVVTANAQAQAAISQANGIAQSNLINATAQVKVIQEIGAALQSNPNYLRYQQIIKWDGALPRYVGQGATPMFDMTTPDAPASK